MGSADTDRMYMCIDLKSFYASVECADLGVDPFTTPLVVADNSRGKGAITLAISPALKKLGVKNRSRLFQIPSHIEYITVKPHMKRYMQASAQIYGTLLNYISPEDIHVYSIDEYFIDITPYTNLYKKTPRQLAQLLLDAVLSRSLLRLLRNMWRRTAAKRPSVILNGRKMLTLKNGPLLRYIPAARGIIRWCWTRQNP